MVDQLQTLKTLLENNWISGNTDDITPTVKVIMDVKTIDAANGDFILLYEIDEGIEPFGVGAQEWAHDRISSVDIRTTYKRSAIPDIRAHLIKMKDEVFRIFKANVSDPDVDNHILWMKRKKDLSDKSIGIGRIVIDTSLKYWGA